MEKYFVKIKYLSLLLFLFLLPGEVFASCTISSIGMNNVKQGSWSSSCLSTNRIAAYAQFYTFTLSGTETVTIDLESSKYTFLILLEGSGTDGSVIEYDANGDGNETDSQIIRTLGSGTYTIEATTLGATTKGNFTVRLSNRTPPPEPCIGPIDFDTNVSGSWSSNCVSESDRYSQYYTFTLQESQELTIDLNSSQDTFLALLSGSTSGGIEIASNHNNPNGSGSQIVINLQKGNYTVQASSWVPGTNGDFVVSVNVMIPNCEGSVSPMAIDSDMSGSWSSSCVSDSDRYSQYYTFTLQETLELTIDLNSSRDTYLALLSGSTIEGSVIAANHNNPNGSGSQIVITLEPGDYTVQASSWAPGTSGNFDVSVSAAIPACVDCPFLINTNLNDVWFNTFTSGQGFLIIVFPQMKELFVAWFTFDVERPPEDAVAILGGPGQRWLTAQGPYEGDTANLTLYVTKGGVFDSVSPDTTTDAEEDGTMIIEFANCEEGLVNYEITSLGISGEIPIQRIVTDNVPACELYMESAQ
jgi:hypothetical protein